MNIAIITLLIANITITLSAATIVAKEVNKLNKRIDEESSEQEPEMTFNYTDPKFSPAIKGRKPWTN